MGLSVAEWTQHVLWQSASTRWFISATNQCQNQAFCCLHSYLHSRLHQTEIKKTFILLNPTESPQMKNSPLITPSSGKATDLSWSKLEQVWGEMVTRHSKTHLRFVQILAGKRRVLVEEALRPERSVVQEGPPELFWSVVAAAACTITDTTLQQNSAEQNY